MKTQTSRIISSFGNNRRGTGKGEKMKRREFALEPETVAERDGVNALRLAVAEYAPADHSRLFAFGGALMAELDADVKTYLIALFQNTATDDYWRDDNGIDIRAALSVLKNVKGV